MSSNDSTMANKRPQEFVVLRCKQATCAMFQVHPSKKSAKFDCKVCQEKNAVLKIWSKGNGAECRKVTQRLNWRCRNAADEKVEEEIMLIEDENYQDRISVINANDGNIGDDEQEEEDVDIVLDQSDANLTDDSKLVFSSPICSGAAPRNIPIDYSFNNVSVTVRARIDGGDGGEEEMASFEPESPKCKRMRVNYHLFQD